MGTNKNVVVSFSIAILLLLSLLLLLTYNSKCNQSHNTAGPAMQNSYNVGNYSKGPEPFYFEKFTQNEPFATAHSAPSAPSAPMRQENHANGRDESFGSQNVEPMADLASVQMSNEVSSQWSARANQQTQNTPMMSSQGQGPAGSFNGDSSYQPVSNMGGGMGGAGDSSFASNQQGMQSCFPRDRLTADDLLPKDAADSKWAQINPSGGGNISDQNYLTAGFHTGVNTVGQSLRNANLQLRSEIPNPQDAVGPWMISTIEPDLRQNTLEIGSSISY
jgi:hypothetical protein